MKNNIGSVSHATMRPEDLIPALIDELNGQKPLRREHRKLVRQIMKVMDEEEGYYDSEGAEHDLEELFDALNEYCPPYFYFGAHPGDGSDYGYWLQEDFPNECFDGLKVNDISEIPRGHTGEVLYINDHGNCTLYRVVRGRRYEIWSIV